LNLAESIITSALSVRSARALTLAENLANSDVPGYLPRDIDFPRALEQAIEQSSRVSREDEIPSQIRLAPEDLKADSSGVDVAKELSEVFQNSLAYVATMKLFGDMMNRLKTAFS
jgi:flagellar basal-body rod protein FlgB